MSAPAATLVAAGVAGSVAALGWLAVHLFTSIRDRNARIVASQAADRVKRLELLLKQAEAQISQFYGPVHGIIHQIWAVWDVKQRFRGTTDPDTLGQIEHFLGTTYFAVYHDKIRMLMRDNMHLIEGATMPESFYVYIQHSVMENIQTKLWDERHIDTSATKGIPWPPQFPNDVERGLRAAIARYDDIVKELSLHSQPGR